MDQIFQQHGESYFSVSLWKCRGYGQGRMGTPACAGGPLRSGGGHELGCGWCLPADCERRPDLTHLHHMQRPLV